MKLQLISEASSSTNKSELIISIFSNATIDQIGHVKNLITKSVKENNNKQLQELLTNIFKITDAQAELIVKKSMVKKKYLLSTSAIAGKNFMQNLQRRGLEYIKDLYKKSPGIAKTIFDVIKKTQNRG